MSETRYQMRQPDRPWRPVDNDIRTVLELNGFRYSELVEHITDLDAGHVLTSERGVAFRRTPRVSDDDRQANRMAAWEARQRVVRETLEAELASLESTAEVIVARSVDIRLERTVRIPHPDDATREVLLTKVVLTVTRSLAGGPATAYVTGQGWPLDDAGNALARPRDFDLPAALAQRLLAIGEGLL